VKRYTPSLFDKLLDGRLDEPGTPLSYTADQLKDSVARDIEQLLNSRSVGFDDLTGFPHVENSLLTYGLIDISSMSMAGDRDRAAICESIAMAIRRHDSRLTNVRVELRALGQLRNAPGFVIHAFLRLDPLDEAISFDAVLEAASRSYHVSRSDGRVRRPVAALQE
jgi:type VI secretion system protein ImpF